MLKEKVQDLFEEICKIWFEAYNEYCKKEITLEDFLQVEKIAKEMLGDN